MNEKKIAVLYHSGCPDGFGGAYAAWKKFGDTAEYIPVKHGYPVPENLEGKELYFVDFCYPQEIMNLLLSKATSLTVLDHHEAIKIVAESMPKHVFNSEHSGATIAWGYFHPDVPVPTLLKYVEDGDRYVFKLPDSRAVLAYVYAQRFAFEEWDHFVRILEDEQARKLLIEKGRIYAEHFDILVEQIANKAVFASFEGFECYLVGAADMFTSDVGNLLARRKPPLCIIVNFRGDIMSVSLRSDPSVDVSAIARKYGGNGHPQSSAFVLKWGDPLPWTMIEDENPRH